MFTSAQRWTIRLSPSGCGIKRAKTRCTRRPPSGPRRRPPGRVRDAPARTLITWGKKNLNGRVQTRAMVAAVASASSR